MKRICFFLSLAAGLLIAANALAEPEIVERDIAPGEVFKRDHPVVIRGNVGAQAKVTVAHGGIRVEGDVGDGAAVSAHGNAGGNSGNSVVVVSTNGNSTVVVNGHVVESSDQGKDIEPSAGIAVEGQTGDNVRMETDNSIVAGSVGKVFHAEAGGSVVAQHVAPGARIKAGGSITAEDIERDAVLRADGSVTCGDVGSSGEVNAGGSITAGYVNAGTLTAGGSIIARGANDTGRWKAGGSILVSGRQ